MSVSEGRLGRRLQRILLVLPYAIKHPGVTVPELSERFGVDAEELLADLDLVFMCGLPGYGPGDLIDIAIDDDQSVYVSMADYFAAPLRLTPTEALSLYAGGAAMAAMPGLGEADALKSALGKLGGALGMEGGGGLEVRMDEAPSAHLLTIKDALESERRLRLEYLSSTTGRLGERDVDPWGIIGALGRWYLIAWDHSVADERMFRVDRMKKVEVLDAPADVPGDFDPDRYKGAFVDRDTLPAMSFEISPEAAAWFPEYYPTRSQTPLEDGWLRVEMAISGERWPAMLLLRMGRDARAVEPAEIDSSARDLAAEIAALYD